jgi:hypothetical protein
MKHRTVVAGLLAGFLAIFGYPWGDAPVQAQGALPGVPWTCSLDNIGATLTLCMRAPNPGLRRYITSITAQSTTATGGQWILRHGTGTNCGTGTVSLLPSAASAARYSAPANTAAATTMTFAQGVLVVPGGKDLCLLGVATNTTTMDIFGYEAP